MITDTKVVVLCYFTECINPFIFGNLSSTILGFFTIWMAPLERPSARGVPNHYPSKAPEQQDKKSTPSKVATEEVVAQR